MKSKKKWYWILGGILLLVLVAAIIKGKSSKKASEVTVEEVTNREIKERVSGSGKVYPATEVKISSDVSGEIIKLNCKEGDSVKMGQVLAVVNPDIYESSLQRSKASLDNSKAQLSNAQSMVQANKAQKEQIAAQLENAKKIYERNKSLFDQKVISSLELENSLATYQGLQANLKAADANISSAEEGVRAAKFTVKSFEASLSEASQQLGKTIIKAPINGIITTLNVKEGERVVGTMQMAGTEMMRISNMQNMEVSVEIAENDILKVKKGDTASIEVDAYVDRKFKGTVVEVANSSSDLTSTSALNSDKVTNFIVKVRIENNSFKDLITRNHFPFRPGMSATVDIFTNAKGDVLSVPIQSVTTRSKDLDKESVKADDLEEVVFLMQSDSARMVKVKSGIQDDEYIEISEGLKKGDKVITGPYNLVSKDLKQGDKVKLEDPKKKKAKENKAK